MVDLYFEANLPAERPGIRRGYFYLMALNVGFFGFCITRLYASLFARPAFAVGAWIFPFGALVTVLADILFPDAAALPQVVLGYLKISALVIGFAIGIVFFTPRYHSASLADTKLRTYVSWSFVLFALLLALYAVKQIAGDRSEFFTVFSRVHFGVFFVVANLVSLYYSVRYLARPAPLPPVLPPGEIRLTEEFTRTFKLTPREGIIVGEIIAGKSNREIARAVDVTEGTVKIFVHNIYKKTGVNSRMALAALVRSHGLD